MANTTNFNWATPDDTDLVKDGAAAIRTLGSAIDTSLVDLKGGTTGQVLSKTTGTDMDFTWVDTDDANAIQNAIVDAKGDLIAASANDTPARLAVGNNGETLVADSSTTTGLRYREDYAAGKNKIINGDFNINQRAFTSTTAFSYTFDRWLSAVLGTGTTTFNAQTFTPGAAPVAGYEGRNFLDIVTSGQSGTNVVSRIDQRIESVRTFAGQTITVSFWAKAASGVPKIAVELDQQFGTGGSPSSRVTTYAGQVTLSTSWARYSVTVAVPSISGKTIGTAGDDYLALDFWVSAGTDFNARTGSLGIQTNTFSIWGVQVEDGSVATAFQTATGTLAGELAACQRYYYRNYPNTNSVLMVPMGFCTLTTQALMRGQFPVTMRTKPTALEQSGTASDYALRIADTSVSLSAVPAFSGATTENLYSVTCTVSSGLTAGQGVSMQTGASTGTAAYLGWSAEL